MRALSFIAAALCVAAFCLAARGGEAAGASTRAHLPIMVIPKERLGSDAAGLTVGIGSGFTDNAATADDTLDPNDTAGQLARAGRIVGYDLAYEDVSAASFARGSGVLAINSSVDLFRSGVTADAFIAKQVRDARRFRGKRIDFGIRLTSSSPLHVGNIGSHTVGLRTTSAFGAKHIYATVVAFRVGPVVAGVEIDRADGKPVAAAAERLARELDRRVRAAAAGKLRARPVPVPPVGRKGRPPPGGPPLAPMALSRDDLPQGARVVRQGYVGDRQSIGSYERQFDTSSGALGGSAVTFVESDVSLFRSPDEASGFFVVVRAIYEAPAVARDFAKAFSSGAGAKPSAVEIESRKSLGAGDEAIAVTVAFSVGGVRFRAAFVHVRVKRVVGTLIATGRAQTFHSADLEPLATRLARRIDDVL